MTEKKRVPPWEQARLNFSLRERERLRLVEAKQRPLRDAVLSLEENRRRLAEITKNICQDCRRYILSDELTEGERKIGLQFGFCQCRNRASRVQVKS